MDSFESEIGRVMRADDLPQRPVDAALADVRRRAGARRRNRAVGVVTAAAASVAVIVGISAAIGGEPTDVPLGPATGVPDSDVVVPWSDRTDFEEWEAPTAPPDGWPAERPVRWEHVVAGVELPEFVEAGETLEYVVTLSNIGDEPIDLTPCGGFLQRLTGTDINSETIWEGVEERYRLNCDGAPTLGPGEQRSYAMELEVPEDAPSLRSGYLEWRLLDTSPDQRAQDYLAIDGDRELATPENEIVEADRIATAEAFVNFARTGGPRVLFADEVIYFIGGEEVARLNRSEAIDPASWDGCPEVGYYAARDCPVSPLTPVAFIDDGAHVFEAEEPAVFPCTLLDRPTGFAYDDLVVIRPPMDQRNCVNDFAVSLYLDERGAVVALNLVLAEP